MRCTCVWCHVDINKGEGIVIPDDVVSRFRVIFLFAA